MNNVPKVKLGILAVSRDCFPIELSRSRRAAVAKECKNLNVEIHELDAVVENEKDALKALEEAQAKGITALVIYLGNFGPEGPLTIIAQRFKGPTMLVAAAEEATSCLMDSRGDAYCGMLNASISADLRKTKVYIPEYPVGNAAEVADMIKDFVPVARVIIGVKSLKIFAFGPRPTDFVACNAPIKPLFDLGVEVMENSELDLYNIYLEAENHPDIPRVKAEMEKELGK